MRRARILLPLSLAVMVGLSLASSPAIAATYQDCIISASVPTYSATTHNVSAHGQVTCSHLRTLSLTVQLQFKSGSKWVTAATSKSGLIVASTISGFASAPANCSYQYRSRTVATVDGSKNIVDVSNLTLGPGFC